MEKNLNFLRILVSTNFNSVSCSQCTCSGVIAHVNFHINVISSMLSLEYWSVFIN